MSDQGSYLIDGTEPAAATIVLAHGAGGPMQSSFMSRMARGLAQSGIRVVRFNFPYMEAKRRIPDRQAVLLDRWREVISEFGGGSRLVIGGKSLGGRMASLIADEVSARGLVCLGYPFHPPGKPQQIRTAHLETLRTPALIVQGSRDAFGSAEDVESYRLSCSIRLEWIEGGDHSFKPPRKSLERESENLDRAVEAVATFVGSL